jgi:hypothetical protein
VSVDDLLSSLRGIPRLDGSLCRQDPTLWDATNDGDARAATRICLTECPCLVACRAYADSQPPGHLSGICAGELRVWVNRRPRKSIDEPTEIANTERTPA